MAGSFETGRTLFTVFISLYVYGSSILVCVGDMSKNRLGFQRKLKYYREITLAYTIGKEAIRYILGGAVPILFWSGVIALWLIIKGVGNFQLEVSIYVSVITWAGLILIFSMVLVSTCLKIAEHSSTAIRRFQLNARMFYAHALSPIAKRMTKITLAVTNTLKPIKVPCGDALEIDVGFGCGYFYNMLIWILNGLLLF